MNNERVDTFGNRLYIAMKIKNLNQIELSEKTKEYGKEISQSLINKYIKGKAFARQNNLYILGQILNVSEAWLMGLDVPMEKPNTQKPKLETIKIPIVGRVAAGCPILAEEEIIDTVEIPKEWLKDGYNYFGLRVKGDSMFPRILDGDYVIVRQQSEINSGNIGIIRINGDEAVVKEVHITNDGIILRSFNPMYPDMVFSKKDVVTKPVTIIGRVVKMIGNNFEE